MGLVASTVRIGSDLLVLSKNLGQFLPARTFSDAAASRNCEKQMNAPTAMAPKQLNFITGNKDKLSVAKAILGDTVNLQSQPLDLLEIQGTIEQIAVDKCRRAADAVCFSPGLHNNPSKLQLIFVGPRPRAHRRYKPMF